ncbi:hypothetical protein TL16_g03015 [Triparma laevis f. inornata]|uniref:Calmodulin n=1 Tax=Triparma laevis f. inornata TaxID=1714386 RepID=A0A9W6ZV94_9STRA|nr:hypothetical protein TL16_g03015 [Triparma laevis f. inornata]
MALVFEEFGDGYNTSAKTPNPFAMDNALTSVVDPETIRDAISALQSSYNTLRAAGAPPTQLNSLAINIKTMKDEMNRILEERRKMSQLDDEIFGPGTVDDVHYNKNVRGPRCTGRKLFAGVIEKFQRGDGGFSALWKRRWVVVEKGWLKCYATECRPEPATKDEPEEQPVIFISLTDKTTNIETQMSSAHRKKFGGNYSFAVTSKDMFGTRRSMTFNAPTDKDRLAWIDAIRRGVVVTKYGPTPSIFRAASKGEFKVLEQLITGKGKNVNATNRYGMTALSYAVITAARSAEVVSKGKVPEVPLPTAFQCVALLMSKGANPTQCNENGEDTFDVAKKATENYPRAKRLLFKLLDSSTYMADGGAIWVEPESEAKLRWRIEMELNGIMVEDVMMNKEEGAGRGVSSGKTGNSGFDGDGLKNVSSHGPGGTRKVKMLYTKKNTVGQRAGYNPEDERGAVNRYLAERNMAREARNTPGYRQDALWPEHHRQGQEYMPLQAKQQHLAQGRLRKDSENALVKFYRSGRDEQVYVDNPQNIPAGERAKRDELKEEYLDTKEMRRREKSKNRPSSAPGGRSKSKSKSKGKSVSYGKDGKYKPGFWTTDLPEYGTYTKIMTTRPSTAATPRAVYSHGSYPGMFEAKDKAAAARQKPGGRQRPSSAGVNGSGGGHSGSGGKSGGRSRSASAGRVGSERRFVRTSSHGKVRNTNTNERRNMTSRRDKHVTIDRNLGVQVGKNAAPPARDSKMIGREWFGKKDHKPLRETKMISYPEQHRAEEIERKLRFKPKHATFGMNKDSGTKQFRSGFDGRFAGGEFLHDQAGGAIAVAGSAAAAAKAKHKYKPPVKNKEALAIIQNWHALGGSNIAKDFLGSDTEHSMAISYDTLNDMFDAFRMIQKTHHADGDMVSADALRKLLSCEAERMTEGELDKLMEEADKERTGFINFKQFCRTILDARLPHLPKGSSFGPHDDIVMATQRKRIAKEKAEKQRRKDLKAMGLDPDIVAA